MVGEPDDIRNPDVQRLLHLLLVHGFELRIPRKRWSGYANLRRSMTASDAVLFVMGDAMQAGTCWACALTMADGTAGFSDEVPACDPPRPLALYPLQQREEWLGFWEHHTTQMRHRVLAADVDAAAIELRAAFKT